MDTKEKDVKGKNTTANQVKNDKNTSTPPKKRTDEKSDNKKGDVKKAGDKRTATENK